MSPLAFSTLACPDWSWHELLDHARRYGYDGVEVRLLQREVDLLKVPEFRSPERARRRSELRDAGLCVCGLASSVRFDHADAADRRRQLDIGRAYVDLALELGAPFVRVFGDTLPANADDATRRSAVGQIADGLNQLGSCAAAAGVQILLETHGDFFDSRLVAETMRQVASPAAGVLWDTHHPWRFCSEPLDETLERLQPWLRHTHWKDSIVRPEPKQHAQGDEAARQAHDLMSGHRHADYVLFGGGEFPAAECMRLLVAAGYDGWHSYEWEKAWHPEIEDPEIALPLFPAKIRWLEQWARSHVPAPDSSATCGGDVLR
ncbi:MAG TPA: sugar phosphate isomerase/epimerase family protein [Planctomycetaceae bacterium]|nr:sugar phosphate isomerase/epimerase family protein [Planctomycetaceae bacterium]